MLGWFDECAMLGLRIGYLFLTIIWLQHGHIWGIIEGQSHSLNVNNYIFVYSKIYWSRET